MTMTDQQPDSHPEPQYIDPSQLAEMIWREQTGTEPPEQTVTYCLDDGSTETITWTEHKLRQRESHRLLLQKLHAGEDRIQLLRRTINELNDRLQYLLCRQTEMIEVANRISVQVS
jgi:hypothetical protein